MEKLAYISALLICASMILNVLTSYLQYQNRKDL